jgi:hypothetical protein
VSNPSPELQAPSSALQPRFEHSWQLSHATGTGTETMAASSVNDPITMDLPPDQRPGYMQQAQAASQYQYAQPGSVQYTTAPSSQQQQQFAYTTTPRDSASGFHYAQAPDKITFSAKPVAGSAQQPAVRHSAQPASPAYPHPPAQPQYTAVPHAPAPPPLSQPQYAPPPMGNQSARPEHHRAHSSSGPTSTYDGRKVVEMVPGGGGNLNAPPSPGMRPHSLSVGGGGGGRPDGLTQRMDRLSVSGNRPDLHNIVPGGMPGGFPGGGGMPPPSPLLEAYQGVYQSISPMPQAMMLGDDDIDHLPSLDSLSPRESRQGRHRAHSRSGRSPSPLPPSKRDKLALAAYSSARDPYDPYGDSDRDRDRNRDRRDNGRRKEERRARVYDAEPDALAIVDALSARTPDVDTLIDILPALSHDQMLELRTEYKRHCKVQGRGINIAKHIKLKTSGNFGKIAYVTALGKYEGEGYWANYWYQSNSARRELLIEALMGRQNHEIRAICESFKDKRYSDSLVKCMDKELKADKFRKAVLMALEGKRQEESDVWPVEYRNRDVDTLYKALKSREGGESAILGIVVMRSDAHLRECLRTYERKYQGSFARDCLRKSNNLVVCLTIHYAISGPN